MKTIKLQAVDFDDLKVGDKFSLSPNFDIGDKNYLNVVVKPSLCVDTIGSPNEHPFNVVALEDGRPRSFQAGQLVYKYVEEDVYSFFKEPCH